MEGRGDGGMEGRREEGTCECINTMGTASMRSPRKWEEYADPGRPTTIRGVGSNVDFFETMRDRDFKKLFKFGKARSLALQHELGLPAERSILRGGTAMWCEH